MSVAVTQDNPTLAPLVPDDQNKLDAAGIAFTRTGSATRFNSSGTIQNVPAHVPRFDYDPITLALRGLLIEEGRSNLILWSGAIGMEAGSPSVWGFVSATASASSNTTPAGTLTGTKITVSSTTGRTTQTVAGLTIGQVYAWSVWIAAGTISAVNLRAVDGATNITRADANLSGGTVALTDVGSPSYGIRATIERHNASSYYRVTVVFIASNTSMQFQVINGSGSAAGDFHVWGAQLEACGSGGYNSTSYIPTTSAAVSRGADTLTVPLSDKMTSGSGLLSGGVVVAEFLKSKLDTNQDHIIWAVKNSGSDYVKALVDTSARIRSSAAGAGVGTTNYTADTTKRFAVSWAFASASISVAGAAAETQAISGAGVDAVTLQIGFYDLDASYLNGHIRYLAVYDNAAAVGAALDSTDLATLSGGNDVDGVDPVFEIDITETDLEELTGDLDLPRIAYHDLALDATVTASSEDPDYPADAAQRIDTYERWRASAAGIPAWWQADFGSAQFFDYCFIAAHDLGSKGCTVKLQYSGDAANWLDASDEHSPEDDSEIMLLFAAPFARYARLYITQAGSPTEVPTIGVIKIGRILAMQRTIYGGHTPITLARQAELGAPISKGGNLLAQHVERSGFQTQAAFRHLEPEWLRENFQPFMDSVSSALPFGFSWRPEDWPDEVAYCWCESPLKPSNMGVKDFMQVTIPMTAYDGQA